MRQAPFPAADTNAPETLSDTELLLLEQEAPQGTIFSLTRLFELALLVAFASAPLIAIVYLLAYIPEELRFTSHPTHELAIGIAILISAFISGVTWRCYRSSGDPFLRWMTLSFLGFTLVYAPHGLLTRIDDVNPWLWLFYGPVSRLLMAACLFIGLLTFGHPPHDKKVRHSAAFWGGWIAAFLALDVVVAGLATGFREAMPILRLGAEYGALALSLLGIGVMLASRLRSPLMLLYALSLAFFAQSSLAFVIAKPWDHLWWLAHAVSAGGFLLLSYGVLHAFHTTRSFSLVFSQGEAIAYLRAAKARTDRVARELQDANDDLARLAATDPLTGVANRRHFIERTEVELARADRAGTPLAVLALDLDHFKLINDRHGHATGDKVLQRFCRAVGETLRPSDLLGRLGGEEFMVLLPEAGNAEARRIAERVRATVEHMSPEGDLPNVTTSVGIACRDEDGRSLQDLFRVADERLYRAKHLGRNTVVGDDGERQENDNPQSQGQHTADS